jgi:hypothetical protein
MEKTLVFMMQLTSDDESSEIIEIFPEEPCVSLSAEFVALGLNRSQIFLGFRDHVAMVIRAETKFPGKYSKNKARIPLLIEKWRPARLRRLNGADMTALLRTMVGIYQPVGGAVILSGWFPSCAAG